MKFSDKEIAALLNEVSETLAKSEKAMKKALPGMEQEPTQEEAPPVDAAPEQAPAPEMGEQAPTEQNDAPPMEGDEAIADEGDAPLTDEELTQVYSAMEPEEIERHFMIIREILQGIYGEQGEEQVEGEEAAPAPEMGGEEAAPAPQMEAGPEAQPEEDESAFKSENKILKNELETLKASLGNLAKAMESMAPTRKSATGTLNKSEGQVEVLNKTDLRAKCNDLAKNPKLTKTERSTINAFCLAGVGAEEVMKIITNHGGI